MREIRQIQEIPPRVAAVQNSLALIGWIGFVVLQHLPLEENYLEILQLFLSHFATVSTATALLPLVSGLIRDAFLGLDPEENDIPLRKTNIAMIILNLYFSTLHSPFNY